MSNWSLSTSMLVCVYSVCVYICACGREGYVCDSVCGCVCVCLCFGVYVSVSVSLSLTLSISGVCVSPRESQVNQTNELNRNRVRTLQLLKSSPKGFHSTFMHVRFSKFTRPKMLQNSHQHLRRDSDAAHSFPSHHHREDGVTLRWG